VQSALVRLLMRGFGSTNVMTTNTTQLAISVTEAVLAWRKKYQAPGDSAVAAEFAAICQQLLKVLPLVSGFLLGTLAGAIAYVQIGLQCALAAPLLVAGIIIWLLWSDRSGSGPTADVRLS
jgi:hypothetical protein